MICALCGGQVEQAGGGWLHKNFLRVRTLAWHIAVPVTKEPTVFYQGDYPRLVGADALDEEV